MGALVSRKYDLIYDEVHGVKKYRGEFEAIGLLQKEVGLLFEFFKLIDIDNSGSIMLLELTEFIELEESSFAKKAFRAFDLDKSKTIDFHEFVLAVWDYCTLSRDNLALFAFSLYDADDSGMIDKKEMEKMLKDLYGNQYKDSPHAMALYNRLAEMQQKYIDEPFFVDFARTHPAMLYPATVLQIKLRERVLSEKFWADQLRKRNQRFKGKYVSIKQIIRSTGRENSFDEDGEFLAQLCLYLMNNFCRDQKVLKEALGERFSNRPPCSKPNNQGAQDASNKAGPAREDRRKSSVDIRKPPPAFDHPPFHETIDNRSTSDSSSWSAKSETTSGKLKNQRRGSSKVKPHSDGTKPLPPDAAGWTELSVPPAGNDGCDSHQTSDKRRSSRTQRRSNKQQSPPPTPSSGSSARTRDHTSPSAIVQFLWRPFRFGRAVKPVPTRERIFSKSKKGSNAGLVSGPARQRSSKAEKAVRRDSTIAVLRRVSSKSLGQVTAPSKRVKKLKFKSRRVVVVPKSGD